MSQLILVLEENLEIQQVITASFKDSVISVVNESDPEYFFRKVIEVGPTGRLPGGLPGGHGRPQLPGASKKRSDCPLICFPAGTRIQLVHPANV